LIAGKVLAKVGILAKLGLLLAKFWKLILVAVVGAFGAIRRFFTGKQEAEAPVVVHQEDAPTATGPENL